jgi:hypothetical protein
LRSGRGVDYEAGFVVVMRVTYFLGYVDPVLEFWQILEVGCVADVSEEYSGSIYWVAVKGLYASTHSGHAHSCHRPGLDVSSSSL